MSARVCVCLCVRRVTCVCVWVFMKAHQEWSCWRVCVYMCVSLPINIYTQIEVAPYVYAFRCIWASLCQPGSVSVSMYTYIICMQIEVSPYMCVRVVLSLLMCKLQVRLKCVWSAVLMVFSHRVQILSLHFIWDGANWTQMRGRGHNKKNDLGGMCAHLSEMTNSTQLQ